MCNVIVRVSQGLANRMFQLAYAYSLKYNGYDVKIDYCRNIKFDHEAVEVKDIFDLNLPEASTSEILKLGGNDTLTNKILRRLHLLSKCRVIPFDRSYKAEYSVYSDHTYVIGTFQSLNYFRNVQDLIRELFRFPQLKEDKNIELAKKMALEESVAVHIRKGADYNKDILKNTCSVKYYEDAIAYMNESLGSPVFYIFTDNPDWVKNNIKCIDYTLVDWNPTKGKYNYLDMQIMSLAKHNIIANSTYSWWSAWLNNNPDKIIIAPSNWYNPSMKELRNLDIVPEGWKKI